MPLTGLIRLLRGSQLCFQKLGLNRHMLCKTFWGALEWPALAAISVHWFSEKTRT